MARLGEVEHAARVRGSSLMEEDEIHGADLPTLLDHAFQTAERCRLAHPEAPWLHLVGLIHGLGKLLAHAR